MREVGLETLKAEILKPGIEKYLTPLCDWRGKTIGTVHRMWNYSVSMMLHEATLADATQRLGCNSNYSQLCMPERRPTALQIGVFTGVLNATPNVARNQLGLLDYLRGTSKWIIDPRYTWHRTRESYKPYDTFYPFIVHSGKRPVDPLVELINKAVPRHFDRERRADLCQDLAVAILCGDLKREEVEEGWKAYRQKMLRMYPTKYADLSLDEPIPGTGGELIRMDNLVAESDEWETSATMNGQKMIVAR